MTLLLPTEPSSPPTDGLLYERVLLYGPRKIGKTRTSMRFTERPLHIDTQRGSVSYKVRRVDCPDWTTFRQIGAALAKGDVKNYTALVVDTAGDLAAFCSDHVIGALAGRDNNLDRGEYHHPSDFEYGKGWSAVRDEFELRIAKLCGLGLPALFIAHEDERDITARVGKATVFSPDVGTKGVRNWLTGFCDLILRATVETTTEGDRRVIETRSTPYAPELGGRTPDGTEPLPATLPLDGAALTAALSRQIVTTNGKK